MKLLKLTSAASNAPLQPRIASASVRICEVKLRVTRRRPLGVDPGTELLLQAMDLGGASMLRVEQLAALFELHPALAREALLDLVKRNIAVSAGGGFTLAPGLVRSGNTLSVEESQEERALLVGRREPDLVLASPGKLGELARLPALALNDSVAVPQGEALALSARRAWNEEGIVRVECLEVRPARLFTALGSRSSNRLQLADRTRTVELALPAGHGELRRLEQARDRALAEAPRVLEEHGTATATPSGEVRLELRKAASWDAWRAAGGGFASVACLTAAGEDVAVELGIRAAPANTASARVMFRDHVLEEYERSGYRETVEALSRSRGEAAPWRDFPRLSVTTAEVAEAAWALKQFRVAYRLAREEDGL